MKALLPKLREVFSALDDALGDSDITYLSMRDLRIEYPTQWAATKLMLVIVALEKEESQKPSPNNARDEIAALANELEDFNSRRVAPYGRITEIVAKMRQLSLVVKGVANEP